MFDCGTPEDFRCGFDSSNMFQSGALYINRHAFEMSRRTHQNNHRAELNALREALGGLSEEDEEELLSDGIQSAREMLQQRPPISAFSSRRGQEGLVNNQGGSYASSVSDDNEPKFTGKG